jgi:hypothetical protein
MTTLKAVELPRPETEGMLRAIDKLRARVEAGEYSTIWIMAFTPDGQMLTIERGQARGRLAKIGQLEIMKHDLINAMEPGEESGSA